jgi:hypothetical protein
MPLTFTLAFDVAVALAFQLSAERTVSPEEKRISAPSLVSPRRIPRLKATVLR